jgi:hypothetical protein
MCQQIVIWFRTCYVEYFIHFRIIIRNSLETCELAFWSSVSHLSLIRSINDAKGGLKMRMMQNNIIEVLLLTFFENYATHICEHCYSSSVIVFSWWFLLITHNLSLCFNILTHRHFNSENSYMWCYKFIETIEIAKITWLWNWYIFSMQVLLTSFKTSFA